jgi:tetratricopeptide (TPR) repeat protein
VGTFFVLHFRQSFMRCSVPLTASLAYVAILSVTVASLLAGSSSCYAQISSLKARYDADFAAMLAEPANLDRIFDFANIAAEYGDFEGAIGAYERLLLYNPDLPLVRYDLGRLYYRLGSYAVAQHYFEEAVKAPNLPPDVREDIKTSLVAIRRKLARDLVTGSLSTGLRYQTNANAASTAGIARVFGINQVSPEHKIPDLNVFLAGDATYIHDFESQGGETLETNASAYAAQQFRAHNLSLAIGELSVGPRVPFRLTDNGALAFSVRPYLVGDAAALDYVQFFRAYGGGTNLRLAAGSRLQIELDYRFQHRDFFSTAANPTLSQETGDIGIAQLTANYAVTDQDFLGLYAELTNNNAVAGFESYMEYATFVTYGRSFAAPFAVTDTIWSMALRGGRIWRPYREPEALIDPDVTRYDRQWEINLSLSAPLNASWAINAQALQDWVRSTLPNFQYTNTTTVLGVSYSF